jgi:hypothetical protein
VPDGKQPSAMLFKSPQLNQMVFIKEVHLGDRDSRESILGTKAFFPYNKEDVYKGGRSAFIGKSNFVQTLSDYLGLHSKSGDAFAHDMQILEVLDGLPSLDGFLLRDALTSRGWEVDDRFFDITGEEWDRVRSFIRAKLEPIVRVATAGNAYAEKTDFFVQKICEASDLDALAPFVAALRLPKEHALDIFKSSKGINFYAYQYTTLKPMLVNWAMWFRDCSFPRDVVPDATAEHPKVQREMIESAFRSVWKDADKFAQDYDKSYRALLAGEEGAKDFITFVQNARNIYWTVGELLRRLSHAHNCWNRLTEHIPRRILKSEELERLFDIEAAVLSQPVRASARYAAA